MAEKRCTPPWHSANCVYTCVVVTTKMTTIYSVINLVTGRLMSSECLIQKRQFLKWPFKKNLLGRKEQFYLTTHSTHFILWLYGVGHMVKDHSDSERGNPLPPHGLLFLINRKGSFICTIPQTG